MPPAPRRRAVCPQRDAAISSRLIALRCRKESRNGGGTCGSASRRIHSTPATLAARASSLCPAVGNAWAAKRCSSGRCIASGAQPSAASASGSRAACRARHAHGDDADAMCVALHERQRLARRAGRRGLAEGLRDLHAQQPAPGAHPAWRALVSILLQGLQRARISRASTALVVWAGASLAGATTASRRSSVSPSHQACVIAAMPGLPRAGNAMPGTLTHRRELPGCRGSCSAVATCGPRVIDSRAGGPAATPHPPSIRLATSSSMTSVAPPPMACTRASRAMRSIAVSRIRPMPPWNCRQS